MVRVKSCVIWVVVVFISLRLLVCPAYPTCYTGYSGGAGTAADP